MFKNYPVRISEGQPEKRVEYYPDFNSRLIHAIWKEIENYDDFAAQALNNPVSLRVGVKNAPAFDCEIRLKEKKSKQEFTAEMPDAIINRL